MALSTLEGFDFDWMLAPRTAQEFIGGHLNAQALRIERGNPTYYADILSEEDLEFALSAACGTRGAVEELLAGDQVRPCKSQSQAVEVYKSGKSLRIVAIQRFSPKIAHLCRSISEALQCRVQTNLYLTPGGSKALNKHFDTHDVFVLQIHGSKRWTLYDNPVMAPLEVLPLLRHESVHEMKRRRLVKHRYPQENSSQREEFLLEAGELLYLPRGHWHNAQSEPGRLSCHLTIGLQAVTYTDLLTAAIGQASFTDSRIRESLPLDFMFGSEAAAHVAEQTRGILKSLVRHVDPSVCLGQLSRNLAQSARDATGNGLLADPAATPVEVHAESAMHVRSGLILALDTSTDPPELCFGNKSFGVAAPYIPAIRWIARQREFAVSELPGDFSDEQRVLFVRDLITVGLLESVRSPQRAIPTPGWLPAYVNTRAGTVAWLDCALDDLPEPFAKQSFDRIKANSPASAFRVTPLADLEKAVPEGPAQELQPAGFIFHVSRCGSTLLSNCLKQVAGTRVLSEPQPVSALLQWAAEAKETEAEAEYRLRILKAAVEAYGRFPGQDKRFLFKLTSWNILHFHIFRRLWPETPCVVVVRDPLEVGVSCMETPPGWMNRRKQSVTSKISRESFCARMLGRFYTIAKEAAALGALVVQYEGVDLDTCLEIARTFGLAPDQTDIAGIQRALSINAKHPELGRFETDSPSKAERASDRLKREIDLWAREAFEALRTSAEASLTLH